jgi:hypothetical protein
VLTLIVGASIHLAEPLAGAIARGASGGSATDDVVFARIFQARSAEVTEWVRVHTPADARVMTELGGAIYLRTGRVTVIGVPEEPFTGPTVLLPAGRYLAERLLADGVTHVVAWAHMGRVLMAQVDAVQRACPGVLEQLPPYPPDGTRSPARYFRVASGGEACLRSFIARTGGATDGGTAGASQAMASTDADPRLVRGGRRTR